MFGRVLTFKRFIFYGFPIYLVLAEYAIRFLLSYAPGKVEDLAVVGSTSTVTAAGLSLIAPILIPKPVTLNRNAAGTYGARRVQLQRLASSRSRPISIAVAIYLIGMLFTEVKEVV